MMTIPMIRISAMKKVVMNFETMYASIFFGLKKSIFLKSCCYSAHSLFLPRLEVSSLDVLSGFTYEVEIERKIMLAGNLSGKDFSCHKEMSEICLCVGVVYE